MKSTRLIVTVLGVALSVALLPVGAGGPSTGTAAGEETQNEAERAEIRPVLEELAARFPAASDVRVICSEEFLGECAFRLLDEDEVVKGHAVIEGSPEGSDTYVFIRFAFLTRAPDSWRPCRLDDRSSIPGIADRRLSLLGTACGRFAFYTVRELEFYAYGGVKPLVGPGPKPILPDGVLVESEPEENMQGFLIGQYRCKTTNRPVGAGRLYQSADCRTRFGDRLRVSWTRPKGRRNQARQPTSAGAGSRARA